MPTTLLPPPNFHTFLRPLLVITAYSVLSQGVGGHPRSHILANQLTQSQQSGWGGTERLCPPNYNFAPPPLRIFRLSYDPYLWLLLTVYWVMAIDWGPLRPDPVCCPKNFLTSLMTSLLTRQKRMATTTPCNKIPKLYNQVPSKDYKTRYRYVRIVMVVKS